MSARDAVEAHYAAYAANDVAALAATLSETFVCAQLNGAALAKGREAGAQMYAGTIRHYPMALTEVVGEIALGSVVVKHERSRSATGRPDVEMLAIYTVADGLIARTDMAMGPAGDISAVERQLEAYNRQDLEAHCACFADDVIVADLNGAVSLQGKAAYRERYQALFAQHPHNRADLVARLAAGGVVVDHERVRRSPDAAPFEVLAIYTLRDDLIARVDFVR